MCHLNSTKDLVWESFVGDHPGDCRVVAYSDSDFASDLSTSKSTTGGFVAIVGWSPFSPKATICK